MLEVAGKLGRYVVPDKLMLDWCHLEIDIFNTIGSLVTPVSDDGATRELEAHGLQPLMVSLVIVIHLTDALQTGRRSHELEDIIHGKSAAHLGLAGRCLEA